MTSPWNSSGVKEGARLSRSAQGRIVQHLPSRDELPSVLILGDHFGYAGNVVHGVTTYYLHTLPALAERGVRLRACFLREPHPAAEALRQHGIEPIFLSARKWNPLVAFHVATVIRACRCDIVHAAGIKATLIARIAARLAGARVIVHVHDLGYPAAPVGLMHRLFAKPADVGIGVSRAARDVLVRGYHVAPRQCHVIHNGISPNAIGEVAPNARSRIRVSLAIPDDAGVIAMIARMHPIKGHRTMLRVMARIAAQRPDAVLILAGDGPERSACEVLSEELGLRDRVRFLGSRKDIPELLAACDLVVAPSESEGLPTVAIEACAAGRPVVGFDAGGLRDIIDDSTSGRLIRPGDEEGFARAILDLLGDPDMLARFGREALVRARDFTIDRHVRQLIACYGQTVGLPAAASGLSSWPAG